MPHNTPSFWYPKTRFNALPPHAQALRPLSWFYALGFNIHHAIVKPQKANIPVVCIGNLSAGGTGKTPTCISFVELLRAAGLTKTPYFLMRGYGGAERGPLLVNLEKHNAWDVGDEPLILAQSATTIISADRVEGTNLAETLGADMVIMDDGLQNPGIHKDVKIIVVNGEMGFGNRFVMPTGPLREPLEAGLAKADAFLFIGDDKMDAKELLPEGVPVFDAKLEAVEDELPPKNQKYVAFAGLGYPQKFFDFLSKHLGYEIVETIAFADHCPYERRDVQDLRSKAKALDAELITTEKDYLRLPKGYKEDIHTLPISMQFKQQKELKAFVKSMLNTHDSQAA